MRTCTANGGRAASFGSDDHNTTDLAGGLPEATIVIMMVLIVTKC